ncbi:hypothetical protein DSO57_1009835 [Entomophthora muscae]|uniref:Uncharacterized protein n=1 Tax=Entomophthora muscae TaxID=34485 RepID=A0ACC2TUA5_9FUNG|nr:hypothetical protein DSO57_1009835 [Entomophthora muscae]
MTNRITIPYIPTHQQVDTILRYHRDLVHTKSRNLYRFSGIQSQAAGPLVSGITQDGLFADKDHHKIGANLKMYKKDFLTQDHGRAARIIVSITPVRGMYTIPRSLPVWSEGRLGEEADIDVMNDISILILKTQESNPGL